MPAPQRAQFAIVKGANLKVARMFKRHLKNILTFVRHWITTAAAEGLTGKIPEVKKRAYGFRNRAHVRTAINFHCGGLDRYPAAQ